uniref:Metallo-beta-lactamase domain-containing protein n=1 Tax=Panagrolaimus sp. JU765 TaxID=591449 RepID=A0AC34RQ23_9BILA
MIFRRILIDTGEPGIDEYIVKLREALGDAEIEAIIATHWHHDHIGGIDNVYKLIGKKVPIYKFKREDSTDDRTDFKFVEHGFEVSTEGATLRLLHTPGHTTDHMAVLLKEENVLFSGDCILGEGSAVFEDLHSYMNSLHKFLDIKPATIFPGHGPVVANPETKIKEYIHHRLEREKQIIAALSESDTMTSMDIVNVVYKETPLNLKLAAVGNVRHHLSKLMKDGRVKQVSTDNYLLVNMSHQ